MIRLTKEQLLLLYQLVIEQTGGTDGIRDESLLESALESTYQSFGGTDLYSTKLEKAAHLAYALAMNHPFADGNKRMAAECMLLFLNLNGINISYSQEELSELFYSLADGHISQEQLYNWLKSHLC